MSEDRTKQQNPSSREEKSSSRHGSSADGQSANNPGKTGGGARRREQGSYPNLFAPGSRVGRYRLLAPLASGGMAQVWAAKPDGAGFARTVALKLIRQEYAADEEYARMFVDEATVAASIHHPNVCETYELGRDDGVLFMAIEWVAGDSLAGILHRDQGLQPVSPVLAARIVADACAGLHAAHEAVGPDDAVLGVVHRDVSPPNILLSMQGQVKVSDFGIAKAEHQLHSRTRTGEIKGKFAYIAPEQIGGRNIDRRVDIFALGCVLYVATVGLRPFGSGPRAMSKILSGEYKRPSSLVDAYPPELEQVIARCLQRSPSDRYATADEMRTDLERWLLTSGTAVGTKEIAALVGQRLDPGKRRVVETLMRSNQFLPDAMVYQLVRGEVDQTPTATSSVLFGPASAGALSAADASSSIAGDKSESRPMVRFNALARPMAPAAREDSGTELDEERTTSEDAIPSFSPSSGPSAPELDPGPTFRPPRLAPLHVPPTGARNTAPTVLQTAPSPRLTHRAPGSTGRRTGVWTVVGVLLAIAAGWASCQLLPP